MVSGPLPGVWKSHWKTLPWVTCVLRELRGLNKNRAYAQLLNPAPTRLRNARQLSEQKEERPPWKVDSQIGDGDIFSPGQKRPEAIPQWLNPQPGRSAALLAERYDWRYQLQEKTETRRQCRWPGAARRSNKSTGNTTHRQWSFATPHRWSVRFQSTEIIQNRELSDQISEPQRKPCPAFQYRQHRERERLSIPARSPETG